MGLPVARPRGVLQRVTTRRTTTCSPARREAVKVGGAEADQVGAVAEGGHDLRLRRGRAGRPSRCAPRARVATTRSKLCRPRSHVSSTAGADRAQQAAGAGALAGRRGATRPRRRRRGCRTRSRRRPAPGARRSSRARPAGRPKARALAGVSGTFHLVPSSASRRSPNREGAGGGRRGQGPADARNRAARGRAPSRAGRGTGPPTLTAQASGCGHSHRSPLTSGANDLPQRDAWAYRFMATPKKTAVAAGSFRRRRSRTPHASIDGLDGLRRDDASAAPPARTPAGGRRRRSSRVSSARYRPRARRANFWILPVLVLGRAPNSIALGAL